MGKDNGLMDRNMKVIILRDTSTERENTFGLMENFMKESGKWTKLMAMASTDGQMEEPMKVNAKRIFFTEKENIHGLMAEATKVILLIRKTKDMAFIDK